MNEISLQESLAITKSVLIDAINTTMTTYQLPPYLMELVVSDVLSEIRSMTINNMIQTKTSAVSQPEPSEKKE